MDMFNAIYIGLTNLHIRYTHDNDPRLILPRVVGFLFKAD